MGGPAFAQAPAQPTNAGPVQPWGLPPLPQGVGPVEKFADIGNTPQGKFLEGGAFDDQGNLWFVGIGSGWISYLKPDGTLVPVVNCNPPDDYGQTWHATGFKAVLLAGDPRNASIWFAIGEDQQLHVSTDGGTTW